MPGYRDWEMLNQAITGFGDDAARRRQQNVINSREAERIALEREMRGIQQQREDRRDKAAAERANKLTAYFQSDDGKANLGFEGTWEGVRQYKDDIEKETGQKWHFAAPPEKTGKSIGSIRMIGDDRTAIIPFYQGQEDAFAKAVEGVKSNPAKPEVKAVELRNEAGEVVWVGASDARGNLHPSNVRTTPTLNRADEIELRRLAASITASEKELSEIDQRLYPQKYLQKQKLRNEAQKKYDALRAKVGPAQAPAAPFADQSRSDDDTLTDADMQGMEQEAIRPKVPAAAATAPSQPAPPGQTIPKVANQSDVAEAIRQANEAIAKGKDPKLVRERLKAMGITLQE